MTVHDLIEKLQTMPQGAIVVYRACSNWNELEPKEVNLLTAEESESKVRSEPDRRIPFYGGEAVCVRKGSFCNAYPLGQYGPGEKPVYVDVVTFPGN